MKNTLLTSLLMPLAVLNVQAATLTYPDVEQALEQAKQAGKPAVIIWYGSDWQPGVDAFVKDWQAVGTRHGDTCVFGTFDEKMGQERDRNKVLPIEHFNLPAVVLLAPDGSYMTELSGKRLGKAADAMNELIPLAAKATEYAALVEKARSSKGCEAVTAAARALSMLPIADAMKQKELKNIINKQDPKDESGYRAQFCMDHLGMYQEVRGILKGGKEGKLSGKERDFDAAEAYVRKVLNSRQLKGKGRRQQWLAGLSYVQRERILSTTTPQNRDVTPLLNTFREIVKLDPESQLGVGAAKFLHYWDPNTFNTVKDGYYTRGHQTLGFEKDWHVDVTSSYKGPGTYTFSLVPVEKGNMSSRNFRVAVNGQVVGKADLPEDKNTKTVELNVPTLPKGATLEVWLTAQCNDGWMEATGYIRMEKK